MFTKYLLCLLLTAQSISFLLGIGIGAEYPSGSVSAAEQSEEKGIYRFAQHRWVALATCKPFTSWVSFIDGLFIDNMIIWGFVFAAFVPLVLFWMWVFLPFLLVTTTTHMERRFGNDHLRAVWRLSLGLGFVPAAFVFVWRLSMEEPTRYRKDSMKRVRIPYKLVLKRYWVSLSAISAIWYVSGQFFRVLSHFSIMSGFSMILSCKSLSCLVL